MATYNDTAVVLRTQRLGEADRIVTVLSRGHGKLRGVARGVRRTASKFGARLEPFAHVDLQVTETRSLAIFASVVTRALYGKALLDDYARFTAAEAMVETADKLVPEEGVPALQQYHLLVGALHALAGTAPGSARPPGILLDSYLLRACAVAGYAPNLAACAICGQAATTGFFSPASGGLVCAHDRPPGSVAVGQADLAYLGALLAGDWPATEAAAPAQISQASGLVAAFVNWQVERGVRSLRHVERG